VSYPTGLRPALLLVVLSAGCLDAPSSAADARPAAAIDAAMTIDAGPQIPDLVAYYPMDSAAVGGVVMDASGGGHAASCEVCPAPVEGQVNGALLYTGTELLQIPSSPAFLGAELTVALWARWEGEFGTLVSLPVKDSGTNRWAMFVEIYKSRLHLAVELPGSYVRVPAPSLGVWTAIAFRRSATGYDVVIDGVVTPLPPPTLVGFDDQPILIGADDDGGIDGPLNYLHGAIDEVRLFDRALSNDELAVLAAP
jgi:hypothetical protein